MIGKQGILRMSQLYKIASYVWRNTILKWYRDHKKNQDEKYWMEHTTRRGKENPDKIFYVIRRRDMYCGLFSHFMTVLAHIDRELKAGHIPVVDMQNSFNIYLTEEQIGKVNAWEYYFQQPCGYSLEDIQKSSQVIIGSGAVPKMFPYLEINFLNGSSGELAYWRALAKKYIRLSSTAKAAVEEAQRQLFGSGERILGVKGRGTDYSAAKPKGHPIQPTPGQMLEKAEEIFERQHCTKVFLATEDAEFYHLFRERFGDKLIVNKSEYHSYQGGSIGKEIYWDTNEKMESGMEYLVTTYLLSKCQCLCAGCVSGTVAALILTEGYEYTWLFDLGIY